MLFYGFFFVFNNTLCFFVFISEYCLDGCVVCIACFYVVVYLVGF